MIDSYYKSVIATLTEQGKIVEISERLQLLTTNHEKVLYVLEILQSLEVIPQAQIVTKNEELCERYRNHGNQYYQQMDFYRAWQYYNLSLLYGETGSPRFFTAFSNRTSALVSLKRYQECLNDIEKIFSMDYPNIFRDKLIRRREVCNEALSNMRLENIFEDEINEIWTLQGNRDPRYPCASSKLQVCYSTEMGRHVIAKEDIRVGEVIVQEDPYFSLVLKSQILYFCNRCMSKTANTYPCTSCCFTLYCSDKCKQEAWRDYHEIECPLVATLLHLDFSKLELLALRTVIKARREHNTWQDLFRTIEESESRLNTDLHGCVEVDGQWVYDSKYYSSIHTLESNVHKRSVSDIYQKCTTASFFMDLLDKNTDFMKTDNDSEKQNIRNCVAGLLLHHLMTTPTNMHSICVNIQTADGKYVEGQELGNAAYPFLSLLNHSCSPNVVRCAKLGSNRMTLFALRPIKKGMQIFDNYGYHHAVQGRDERQKMLSFQYKFTCCCEACSGDWPQYAELPRAPRLPPDIQIRVMRFCTEPIRDLEEGQKATALRLFRPLCELAEVLESHGPSIELAECQEALKQCLHICAGLLPFGYTKRIEYSPYAETG